MQFFLSFVLAEDSILNSECPEGRAIEKIRFITDINLEYEDLISNLDLHVGDICTKEKIDFAVSKLKDRNIFEKISYEVETLEEGLVLTFRPIPFLVLSQVEFFGNRSINSDDLLRISGLKIGSHIFSEDVRESERRIKKKYDESGYGGIEIESNLIADRTTPLVSLEFRVKEGEPYKIKELKFEGVEEGQFGDLKNEVLSYFIDETIDRQIANQIKKYTYQELVKLEYYQSSVFVDVVDRKAGAILIKIKPNKKYHIDISGNDYFSRDQLLNELDLENRSVPLRIVALKGWCQDLEIKYREVGFLDVDVECSNPNLNIKEDNQIFKASIVEGVKYENSKVEFIGNDNFTDIRLFRVISKNQKRDSIQIFSRNYLILKEDVPSLIEELKAFYIARGFLDVEIESNYFFKNSENSIYLDFKITEGRQYFVYNVLTINHGSFDQETQEVLAQFAREFTGNVYRVDQISEALVSIEKILLEQGYSYAHFYPEYRKGTGEIFLTLNLGPRIKVRKILTVGNYFTLDDIIKRELKFSEGEYFNEELLDESRKILLGLGIFKSAEVYQVTEGLPPGECDIQVVVKERETGIAQGLVELSSQDGLHLQGQVGQRNLFGTGKALVVSLDGYFKNQGVNTFDAARARAAYANPKIFGGILDYQLEGFFQTNLNLNRTFKYDRIGVTNSLKVPFLETLRFSVGHTYYSERLFDVQPDLVLGDRDEGTSLYSALRATLEYDQRDDPFVATQGYRAEIGGGFFPKELGSQVSMYEAHFQLTDLEPIADFWTYAINLRGAMTRVSGDEDIVPLGSRYFIGGRDTLRGYTRFTVGPRATSGLVVGGDTNITLSQEVRYQLTDQLVGVLFLDMGQSFLVQKSNFLGDAKDDFSSIKYSPGVGTQYLTPIGPLGLEVGFATDREFGERWGRILVSIGSAF